MRRLPDLTIAWLGFCGLAAALLFTAPVHAQAWPTKPITLVQPFAAGGGMDPVARILANGITEKLGQQVVMDYRTGATGVIGTGFVAKAAPDGYTLLMVPNGPIVNAKYLLKDIPYDAQRDLVPITRIAETPLVVLVNSKIPARTMAEFIAYARANPDTVAAANVGVGSAGHLAALMLERQTGIKLKHIPYRGTGQMMSDIVSGQVDLAINFVATFSQLVDAGQLRLLAVLGKDSIPPSLKAFPTAAQAGIPDLLVSGWYALFAPANTPTEILDKLRTASADTMRSEFARTRLEELGYLPSTTTTDEMRRFIAEEDVKWGALIRAAGIRVE